MCAFLLLNGGLAFPLLRMDVSLPAPPWWTSLGVLLFVATFRYRKDVKWAAHKAQQMIPVADVAAEDEVTGQRHRVGCKLDL